MISIKDLRLTYESDGLPVQAVNGVSIDVPKGQFYTLLGPSGCGKSSTLRCVAGLEKPDSGEIVLGGETVFSSARGVFVPPYRRKLGMVFQSYAIWPHMNVFDNVAYPLKYGHHKLPRGESVRDRVRDLLAMVGLAGLEKRPAPLLSGGQQQRLALARAVAGQPDVLLLDEPLSNLDARLRDDMRHEIRELTMRLNITTLFVTHDQLEAFTMSDTVGVMNQGVLVQEGPPAAIYRSPSTAFVANFVGSSNVIPATVTRLCDEPRVVEAETALGPLLCEADGDVRPGETLSILVRPEDVKEAGDAAGGPNTFRATARKVVFLGPSCDVDLEAAGLSLKAVFPSRCSVAAGTEVMVHLPAYACHLMREEAGSGSDAKPSAPAAEPGAGSPAVHVPA